VKAVDETIHHETCCQLEVIDARENARIDKPCGRRRVLVMRGFHSFSTFLVSWFWGSFLVQRQQRAQGEFPGLVPRERMIRMCGAYP
jgi:hypothetical protein